MPRMELLLLRLHFEKFFSDSNEEQIRQINQRLLIFGSLVAKKKIIIGQQVQM